MADIKNMYQGFDRDIEIKHTREIEQFEKNHIEEHMRIVEKCAKQIDHERNAFESQRKEQEKLNEEMTIKLPILKDENQHLKKISEVMGQLTDIIRFKLMNKTIPYLLPRDVSWTQSRDGLESYLF